MSYYFDVATIKYDARLDVADAITLLAEGLLLKQADISKTNRLLLSMLNRIIEDKNETLLINALANVTNEHVRMLTVSIQIQMERLTSILQGASLETWISHLPKPGCYEHMCLTSKFLYASPSEYLYNIADLLYPPNVEAFDGTRNCSKLFAQYYPDEYKAINIIHELAPVRFKSFYDILDISAVSIPEASVEFNF